jgi:orotidine-5'-phosphate decarboxylase
MAAADNVNRYGSETVGKFGYSRVGILVSATTGDSVKMLRARYPKLFMIVDGLDYSGANAKNCSHAFDKMGHGAIACAGSSIWGAWKADETEGLEATERAVAAAERMKKNLTRYVTVL